MVVIYVSRQLAGLHGKQLHGATTHTGYLKDGIKYQAPDTSITGKMKSARWNTSVHTNRAMVNSTILVDIPQSNVPMAVASKAV